MTKNYGTRDYGIIPAELANVTADHAEHLAHNGWRADTPDYIYNDCRIWEGGMGVNLYQTPDGQWFCEV